MRIDRTTIVRISSLLLGAILFVGSAALSGGCGGEPETPPVGSAKFEEEKKTYQEARRKEYNRKSFEPPPAKGARAKK
jgi:hypothetical protein